MDYKIFSGYARFDKYLHRTSFRFAMVAVMAVIGLALHGPASSPEPQVPPPSQSTAKPASEDQEPSFLSRCCRPITCWLRPGSMARGHTA